MIVHSAAKNYTLSLEPSLAFTGELLARDNAFFVIDANVYRLYPALFSAIPAEKRYLLDATEENKVIDTALAIVRRMTDIPGKRNAWLVSFGGGITQDVSGFAANILYRGVRWAFTPTTLLAACDSCLGGKTSLNLPPYKNLLGTFFAPDEIHVCPAFFHTLEEADYLSGLGEVVKFNILAGEDGVSSLAPRMDALLRRDDDAVAYYTERSLAFKKPFVEEDEFDRGRRVLLNYGHTFGHAIESASRYAVPHGTAVAMGSLMANRISLARGMLTECAMLRREALLTAILPAGVADKLAFSTDALVDAVRRDKKNIDARMTAVLLSGENTLSVVHDLTAAEICAAFDALTGLLSGR